MRRSEMNHMSGQTLDTELQPVDQTRRGIILSDFIRQRATNRRRTRPTKADSSDTTKVETLEQEGDS